MPTFKTTLLSLLLLTGVKAANATTITLFQVVEPPTTNLPNNEVFKVVNVSAIGFDPNGGTTYAGVALGSFELVLPGTPSVTTSVTVPASVTFVEAASWLYQSIPDSSRKFNSFESNCTLETDGTKDECIQIAHFVEVGTTTNTVITTRTVAGQAVPWYTVTVNEPVPTGHSSVVGTPSTVITTSSTGQAAPRNTGSVLTGHTSPSTSAATILRNPLFNGLSGIFLGIFFVEML